ncbi:MAG: hypothetical protein ABIU87_13760 [Ornithinibacter sp.]
MSDTQVMGSLPEAQDVQAYITAVRAWLGDLPPEDVDDLTLGMEADLAERVAESGGRLGDLLGQPETYAAELRSAAGLAPRAAPVDGLRRERGVSGFWSWLRGVGNRLLARFPWLSDLRPVWWLARGAVLAWVVVLVLGITVSWLLIPLGAGSSFWWGRRSVGATRTGAARRLAATANTFAAVMVLPAFIVAVSSSAGRGGVVESFDVPGLAVDGSQVQNLYVYDAQGNRVEGARVFDQEGHGLFINRDVLSYQDVPLRPDGTPNVATDVFPLVVGQQDPWADAGNGWTPPQTLPPLPVLPGAKTSTGEGATPAPGTFSTPEESPSSAPTATPSATPTPSSSGG